jgi:hypothetical protein
MVLNVLSIKSVAPARYSADIKSKVFWAGPFTVHRQSTNFGSTKVQPR